MAIRYVPYYPEPLEGQARLDNFVRTNRILWYRDRKLAFNRIDRGMPLYETAVREQVGENPKHNLVMHGECISTCAYLKDQGVEVDLVYIDPPFDSGADYAKKIYVRRNPLVAKALREAEQSLDNNEMKTFEEKMYGDIWDKERYLNWMYENLMAIKSVMSDTASIYVHLDWHIGHYVKILMDEIFGEENFRNEIIWYYPGRERQSDNKFQSKHDVIFFYAASDGTTLNPVTKEWTREDRIKALRRKIYKDDEGREWFWETRGQANGIEPYKRYLDEYVEKGGALNDVWDDIQFLRGNHPERDDYSTQKPEALLERIIKASSNEGMLVADFFGGSGVASVVAHKLGRRFIHNDVNINSIQTARDKLVSIGAEFTVMDVKDAIGLFRNPVQTMEKLPSLIKGLNKNSAFDDKFWAGSITDSQKGETPVHLPNLLEGCNRVLDKAEMNKIIRFGLRDLVEKNIKQVIIYYIDVEDIEELEKFIQIENNQTDIEIILRDLKSELDNVVMEDEATWSLDKVKDGLFDVWQLKILTFHSDYLRKKIDEFNFKGEQQARKKNDEGNKANFKKIEISDEGLECIEWLSVDCTNADKEAFWQSDAEIKIEKTGTVTLNGKKTQDQWDGTIKSEKKPLRLKVRSICGDETVFIL